MPLGVLTVGSLTLNENYTVADATNASSGKRTVQVGGIEHFPGRSLAQLRAIGDDLMSMFGRTVPVTFQHKTDRNGYYTIDDANVSEVHWDGEASSITWSLSLTREGPDNAVDIESRLLTVNRTKSYAGTPEPWHAPPIGHHTYYVGANTPATVVRNGADGPITVYRNIPAGVNPRYGCPVGSWAGGRVKFADVNGIIRTGTGIKLGGTDFWELNNGLIRIRPNTDSGTFTTLLVAVWDGAAWQERAWDVRIAGDSLRPAVDGKAVTVLRNGPEMVTVRLVFAQPSNGQRNLVDLVLRRGSRIVEGYVQRAVSGQISVQLDVAEPFTTPANGYTMASGEDAVGLRWAAGSTGSFSGATNGGVSYTSAVAVDFWIGAEVPRASAGGSNPGFETGSLTPWFTINGTPTVRSGDAKFGTYYGRVVATTAGTETRLIHSESATPGTAGKSYTIAGWIRSPINVTAGEAFLQLSWYNGGTLINGSQIAAPALTANVWTPVVGTAVAPATTTLIARSAGIKGTSVAAGTILDVDSLQVREAIDSGDAAGTLALQYAASTRETMVVVPR